MAPPGYDVIVVGAWVAATALLLARAMVYLAAPVAGFAGFRADPAGQYPCGLRRCGNLPERVLAGRRAERLRAAPEVPNRLRVPDGPGWALVGDAGAVMDPVSAAGTGNALRGSAPPPG